MSIDRQIRRKIAKMSVGNGFVDFARTVGVENFDYGIDVLSAYGIEYAPADESHRRRTYRFGQRDFVNIEFLTILLDAVGSKIGFCAGSIDHKAGFVAVAVNRIADVLWRTPSVGGAARYKNVAASQSRMPVRCKIECLIVGVNKWRIVVLVGIDGRTQIGGLGKL